jgi:molecular chaperone HscB
MDAFDVLGLAPAFDLDPGELDKRYRELQKQLHPDKFVNAPSSERRASLARAMSVNEAYRELKDELKRADLLLARHAGVAMGKATVDPELLTEVMDLREQLAGARKRRDLALARSLAAQVAARASAETQQLKQAFAELGQGRAVGAVQSAAHAITRLRYFRRFQDEVAALEDEFSE